MNAVAVGLALMAVQKTDPDWVDMTDSGMTDLHRHEGRNSPEGGDPETPGDGDGG